LSVQVISIWLVVTSDTAASVGLAGANGMVTEVTLELAELPAEFVARRR
jgi:hypothetical protein